MIAAATTVEETPKPKPSAKAKPKADSKPSQATMLVRLAKQLGATLFHDREGKPFATIPGPDDRRQTVRLKSQAFTMWLSRAFYNHTKSVPNSAGLKDAIEVLAGSALFKGEEHEVHIRVARKGNVVWLDLGHDVVKVTAEGWSIATSTDVLFVRPKGMLPLPVPVDTPPAELEGLLSQVLNVQAQDMCLVIGWLLGALQGKQPYPVLVITGEQASAKSVGSGNIRGLIDPNVSPLRGTPKEPRDLAIAANNSHIMAYDNLSTIPEWLSDDLCRLATGAGFATRKLHTDEDEQLFQAARPCMFNSITDVARRADLISRSMLVHLENIPDAKRLTEREVSERFDNLRPRILGALLNAAVVALQNEASVVLPRLPRLADFAVWVEAAAPALGWKQYEFTPLMIYRQEGAAIEILSTDSLVDAIEGMNLPWTGTPSELYKLLTTMDRRHLHDWPKSAAAMTAKLTRLKGPLRQSGLVVSSRRGNVKRQIEITRSQGILPLDEGEM